MEDYKYTYCSSKEISHHTHNMVAPPCGAKSAVRSFVNAESAFLAFVFC